MDESGRGPVQTTGSSDAKTASNDPTSRLHERFAEAKTSPADSQASAEASEDRFCPVIGPRTERVKTRSRYNAVKHGFYAAVVLEGIEPRDEYILLLKDLREYHAPCGIQEALLVERLAMLEWRRRRVVQAECAEIAKVFAFSEEDTQRAQHWEWQDFRESDKARVSSSSHCMNPLLLHDAVMQLQLVQERVEKFGLQWEKDGPRLVPLRFLTGVGGLLSLYVQAVEMKEQAKPSVSADEMKKVLLHQFDYVIATLKAHQVYAEKHHIERIPYARRAALIPPNSVIDRVIRVETHLSREFDRTLAQLERLQRIRQGQPVPPTLKVEVSK